MTDPMIDRLLGALPDEVMPEPDVAERIRARVAAELHEPMATDPFVAPSQEVQLVTITADHADRRRLPLRPWMLAAAAAVVFAMLGGVLVSGDDDSGSEVALGDATYVGGELTIEPVGKPYWVAADDNVVWVASLDGSVTALDSDTLAVRDEFKLSESSPIAAGHDSLWVADALTGQVLRYQEGPEPTAIIETGIVVQGPMFRDGRLGMLEGLSRQFARIGSITATRDAVWVGDLEGRVLRIDPKTDSVVQTLSVDLEPHVVRAEGQYVAVGDQDAEVAAVYDSVSGEEVFRQDVIGALIGVEIHRGRVLIHDGDAGTVALHDLASGELLQTTAVPVTKQPQGVPLFPPALRASDAGVLVPTKTSVVVLDIRTIQVDRTLDVNGRAGTATIAPDGTAWITQFYGQTLTRLRPVTG